MSDLREIVNRRFTASEEAISPREFTNRSTGKTAIVKLLYVQVPAIIDRLNEAFGVTGWNYEPLETVQDFDKQTVTVKGKLTVMPSGCYKIAYGSDSVAKSGDEADANALKGAHGDALRLCAKMFGIGAYVWMKGTPPAEATEAPQATAATQPKQDGPPAGRPNKYKKPCERCGAPVEEGKGFTQNVGDKWITFHAEGDCVKNDAPPPLPPPAERSEPAPRKAPAPKPVTEASALYACTVPQYKFLTACFAREDLSDDLLKTAAFLVDNAQVNLNDAEKEAFAAAGFAITKAPNKHETWLFSEQVKAFLAAPPPDLFVPITEDGQLPF